MPELILLEKCRPFHLPETDENAVSADQEWTPDQHSVGREQSDLFLAGHIRQTFLQLHGLVEKSAGVEEFPDRKPAGGDPFSELARSGVPFDDMTVFIRNAVIVKKLFRFPAGGSFRIF